MPAHSPEDLPLEFEADVAATRALDQGGMTIALERMRAGVETAPLFRGLPDDACQSPHWGYVRSGRFRVVYADGTEETVAAGQVYYLPAGHNVVFEEDSELIELSPTGDRAATMEHAAQVMAAS